MTPKKIKNNIDDNRTSMVHIAFTQLEKDNITNHAKQSNMSISEFVRQSVFDKIRSIEYPEEFKNNSKYQNNSKQLEQLAKKQEKMIELQQLTIEQIKVLDDLKNSFEALYKQSTKPNKESIDLVVNLFKAKTHLNPDDIQKETNLDIDTIYTILGELQENRSIKLTNRGYFVWITQ